MPTENIGENSSLTVYVNGGRPNGKMPSFPRFMLYVAMATGYVMFGVFLVLFVYQQITIQQQHQQIVQLHQEISNHKTYKEAANSEMPPSITTNEDDFSNQKNSYIEVIGSSLEWTHQGEKQASLFIKPQPTVEKMELESTIQEATTIAATTLETRRNATTNQEVRQGICETDECVLAASNIIRLLNRRADPCEDFYEFACGNFGESPADQQPLPNNNRFPHQIEQTYQFLVEKTLERQTSQNSIQFPPTVARKQDEFLGKLRGFYASCMRQTSFTKYLMELKKFLFGIGNIAARSTNLTKIVGELLLRDVFPLFAISVHRPTLGDGQDVVDGWLAFTAPTRHLHPFAVQPSATSSASFVKIDSVVDLLADELSSAFGIEPSVVVEIDRNMESSRLRNLYTSAFIQANRDCETAIPLEAMPTVLGNFSHLFDWEDLVSFLVNGEENGEIHSVCVSTEFRRYMLSIEPVFANVTKMELLLYSTFKAGQYLINFWTLFEEHANSFSRRAECYKLIHDNFRDFAAEIVSNSLVRPEIEDEISNITAIIRKIVPNFSNINLGEEALAELKKMTAKVPEIRRTDELVEMNRRMPEMSGRSFLPNVLAAWKFKNQRELSKVGSKKIDLVKELDLILSLKAQAAFVPNLRQVRIYPLLLGLIAPELGYGGKSLSTSFVYGTLGFAIAHEFAHVLQFYQEQSVRRDSRLLSTFLARETRRKECLNIRNNELLRERLRHATQSNSPQTSNERFVDEEQDVNSDASDSYLNELWADVLGLKLAFYGYQVSRGEKEEPSLPGLSNVTGSQLFFLSFSQVFCSKTTPSIAGLKRSTGLHFNSRQHFVQYSQNHLSHPPNYVRAALPISLFRSEFAQAFNCPLLPDANFDDCS